ncbi:calcium-binding protein [Methylopila turkensis]|uniref:Calcium-binding protein n=1 Tax=Methylopila turkensis TaxID=1437816 RepID=A0A9W6JNV0_9HYPH|nr:calcium-binding protein [Methylopila turkensis]GLK78893.1 hypothetical protein GCM10008174_06340 [Methylopila turkensis]
MPRVITGTEGDDELRDRPYGDPVIIYGLGGNDTIVSQEGSGDEVYGGDGDDLIRVYSQGFYDGGDGYDTLWIPGTLYGPIPSLAGDSTYTSFEHLRLGGIYDPASFLANSSKFGEGLVSLNAKISGYASVRINLDTDNFTPSFDLSDFDLDLSSFTIFGNDRNNIISGTDARDLIRGYDGNDRITWAANAPTVDIGDEISGGEGNDVVFVYASGAALGGSASGDNGVDTLHVRTSSTSGYADFTESAITNFEVLRLDGRGLAEGVTARFLDSQFDLYGQIDVIRGQSPNSKETLIIETVDGRADLRDFVFERWDQSGPYADVVRIEGSDGRDIINGSVVNDVIDGGAGGDIMRGGHGDDTYIVDSVADQVIEGVGRGLDTVVANVSYTLSANVENLELTETAGAATGVGNELANRITGNAHANTLHGGDGDDVLIGGGGADRLYGASATTP